MRTKHRALLLFAFAVLGLAAAAAFGLQAPDKAAEAVRQNNLGVAFMNQQRFTDALARFKQAENLDSTLITARLNRGIALFNLQRPEEAVAVLRDVVKEDPNNARGWFNLGLLYKGVGESARALEAFNRVAKIDPNDADTHYFRGLLLSQQQQYEPALAAYERALELNEFHVSAEFGMARAYQRLRQTAEARKHLERFQHLTQTKLGSPISPAYTDQGALSLAEEIKGAALAPPPAIPVIFTVATAEAGITFRDGWTPQNVQDTRVPPMSSKMGPGACFFDFDNDSRWDLLLLNSNGPAALYRNAGGGKFENVTKSARLNATGIGVGCTAGDYDNDGWTDLAATYHEGVKLLRNTGEGSFENVTSSALPGQPAFQNVDDRNMQLGVTFLDFDHDGDLDLDVGLMPYDPRKKRAEGKPLHGNILYRNNSNGTFTDWTEPTGLASHESSVMPVVTDFNNDRALDLLFTGRFGSLPVYLNPREGNFPRRDLLTEIPGFASFGAVVLDFDKDGWMDLALTHPGKPLSLWRNVRGNKLETVSLPGTDWNSRYGVAVLDYDNDGWLDLVAAGETRAGAELRLLRNLGRKGFADVSEEVGLTGLKLENPRSLITADYDQDGDTDLLITQNGGPPVLLRNDGGNKNNSIRIKLTGLADNKSAIGTKVEVFAGPLWQKWEVQAASGYLGQSALEIVAGLGQATQADIVRMLWPSGVLQDEIELAAGQRHDLIEIDRRGSSCPVLFAWNGERYVMVSDAIGPAVIGHWVGPGERNVSDPDEYVKVSAVQLQPRNGRLSLRLVEPMEEVVYLDQVRLLAVDHPAGTEINPNEYFALAAPPPKFGVVVSRDTRVPVGAWDDRGRDVLDLVRRRDERFVEGFESTQFTGYAKLHHLELDLGEWDPERPLRLLLHGFVDYFTATSLYSAHQADVLPVSPYVEAQGPGGRWTRVIDDIGFPAGLLRTMVADLTGRLPAGTRRIRLVTNLKIYWDQVLLDSTPESVTARLHEVPFAEGGLGFLGYPRYVDAGPRGNVTYFYDEVSPTGPYARFAGHYTEYGDVRPLLSAIDDRLAIFGPGEEIALEFDPSSLPAPPEGWTRDYLFFAHGFVKDMDFYAAHALTVGPLPFGSMQRYPYAPARQYPATERLLDYRLEHNTRYESGKGISSYRFRYKRPE